jgi:hypothetical protein
MAEDKRIQRIIALIDSINAGQIAIEPVVDADIGVKAHGYKDGDGVARKMLVKGANAPVNNVVAAGDVTAAGQVTGTNIPKSNLTAVVDPTPSDDLTAGYSAGSPWINNAASPPTMWTCLAAGPAGEAQWLDMTSFLAGGATTVHDTGWEKLNSYSLSFDNGTRTLTIDNPVAPYAADYYAHWQRGVEYRKTAPELYTVPDVEGLYLIYYIDGALVSIYEPTSNELSTLIRSYATVAYVYWNAVDKQCEYLGREPHPRGMSPDTHVYLHFVLGAQYIEGLELTDVPSGTGAADTDAQFGVTTGVVTDDNVVSLTREFLRSEGLKVYYYEGTETTPVLRSNGLPGFSVTSAGAGQRLAYNRLNAGTWILQEVSDGGFVLCHVFANNANSQDERTFTMVGQAEYANILAAQEGATAEIRNLRISGLVGPEMVPLWTVVFETDDTFTNAAKARIVGAPVDWREEGGIVVPRVLNDLLDWYTPLAANGDVVRYNAALGRWESGAESFDARSIWNIPIEEFATTEDSITGSNIIANGCFYDGLTGWTSVSSSTLALDTATRVCGSQSLNVSVLSGDSTGGADPNISLEANALYFLSFWAKSDGLAEYIKIFGGSISTSEINITSEWERYSVVISRDSIGSFQIIGYYTLASSAFSFNIDGVECRPIETVALTDKMLRAVTRENGLADPTNLNGAAWSATRMIDGNGQEMIPSTSTGAHYYLQDATYTAGDVVGIVIKVKAENLDHFWVGLSGVSDYFDIKAGVVGTINASNSSNHFVDVGSDGYATIKLDWVWGGGTLSPQFGVAEEDNVQSFTGDSVTVACAVESFQTSLGSWSQNIGFADGGASAFPRQLTVEIAVDRIAKLQAQLVQRADALSQHDGWMHLGEVDGHLIKEDDDAVILMESYGLRKNTETNGWEQPVAGQTYFVRRRFQELSDNPDVQVTNPQPYDSLVYIANVSRFENRVANTNALTIHGVDVVDLQVAGAIDGSDLATDGIFANWTAGELDDWAMVHPGSFFEVDRGVRVVEDVGITEPLLAQNMGLIAGAQYRVYIEIFEYAGGLLRILNSGTELTAAGLYSINFVASGVNLEIEGDGDVDITFGNVQVFALSPDSDPFKKMQLIPEENLFERSEEPNLVWDSTLISFSSINGLIADSNGGVAAEHYISQETYCDTAGKMTVVGSAKPGLVDWMAIRDETNIKLAYFDLANLALGTVDTGVVAQIYKDPANGYTVCKASFDASLGAFEASFIPADSNGGISYIGTDATVAITLNYMYCFNDGIGSPVRYTKTESILQALDQKLYMVDDKRAYWDMDLVLGTDGLWGPVVDGNDYQNLEGNREILQRHGLRNVYGTYTWETPVENTLYTVPGFGPKVVSQLVADVGSNSPVTATIASSATLSRLLETRGSIIDTSAGIYYSANHYSAVNTFIHATATSTTLTVTNGSTFSATDDYFGVEFVFEIV